MEDNSSSIKELFPNLKNHYWFQDRNGEISLQEKKLPKEKMKGIFSSLNKITEKLFSKSEKKGSNENSGISTLSSLNN